MPSVTKINVVPPSLGRFLEHDESGSGLSGPISLKEQIPIDFLILIQ
jgi:hypothetical protein